MTIIFLALNCRDEWFALSICWGRSLL